MRLPRSPDPRCGQALLRAQLRPRLSRCQSDRPVDLLARLIWAGCLAGCPPGPPARQDGVMHLPVNPPVAPMLARPVPQIPDGPFSFEPKWDGFRSIVFRDGGEVEIGSRNERPMTRYFPELVEAFTANLPPRCVVDGEIVIPDASGRRLDFEALLQRIHPAASRVALLAEQTPAHFVAFDLLALDDTDLCAAAVRAAPGRARAGPGPGPLPGAPDPGDHRPGPGRAVVRAVRGGRAGRADRQAAGRDLPAGQAGHVQDQARAHRGLRGGRVPAAQEQPGSGRLAAARAVHRRR